MGAKRPKTELFCHLVWATWDREPLIKSVWEERLHAAMWSKLDDLGCSRITIGGVADHVHAVFRFPPKVSVSEIVKHVKGASSHFASHELGARDFRWQGSYGAFTLSSRSLERTARYVSHQKEHHADGLLAAYLEETEEVDEAIQ